MVEVAVAVAVGEALNDCLLTCALGVVEVAVAVAVAVAVGEALDLTCVLGRASVFEPDGLSVLQENDPKATTSVAIIISAIRIVPACL